MPPVWNFPPDRTTLDSTIVADENAILAILQLLGGNGTSQPTSNIEALKALIDLAEVRSTVKKTASYVILDDDGYTRIECDTTAGDMTITLPTKADNLRRQIEIAVIAGANKVIIAPDGADTNTLSNDALGAMWLPKIGDYIKFQESADSGYWEVLNERITSQLWLTSHAGYGGTDTKIPYFTNTTQNSGNMHTLTTNNNTNGCKVTINRSGRYSISYLYTPHVAQPQGISLNSNQLTTDLGSITKEHRIAAQSQAVDSLGGVSISLYLAKGDIIRPHSHGQATSYADISNFILTYLGN